MRPQNRIRRGTVQRFITHSNLNQILGRMDKSFSELVLADLYESEKLAKILSLPERQLLYAYRKACEQGEFSLERYNKLSKREESNRYVFSGGKPTYHASMDCERLQADYFNLEIPVEIMQRGESQINAFKRFCKNHIDLIAADEPLFLLKLDAAFGLRNPPKRVTHENSGVAVVENFNLEQLKTQIDNLLEEACRFRSSDPSIEYLVARKGYGTHRVPEAKCEESPLYFWHHKIKGELKRLVKEYYRVKFNPDLAFRGDILDQLGFKPCSCVRDRSESVSTH